MPQRKYLRLLTGQLTLKTRPLITFLHDMVKFPCWRWAFCILLGEHGLFQHQPGHSGYTPHLPWHRMRQMSSCFHTVLINPIDEQIKDR